MNKRIIILVLVVVISAGIVFGKNELPGYVRSPVRPGAGPAPATATAGRLTGAAARAVQEQGFADRNLYITGNVAGGRHFRGSIPYNAASELDLVLGSSSLNSFIRNSSGRSYLDNRQFGAIQRYDLPSQTVTSLKRSGQSGLAPPKTTFMGGTGRFAPPEIGRVDLTTAHRLQRPYTEDTMALKEELALQIALQKLGKPDELVEEVERAKQPDEIQEEEQDDNLNKPDEPDKPYEPDDMKTLEQELKKIRDLPEKTEEDKTRELELLDLLNEEIDITKEQTKNQGTETEQEDTGKRRLENMIKAPKLLGPNEKAMVEARTLLDKYKTVEKFVEARLKEHIAASEDFIEQGKYYRAADAFTLAGIYDSKTPLTFYGRTHTFFAAGEYITSVRFLKQAIARSDGKVEKIDLAAFLKDPDVIDRALIDLGQWHDLTKSSDLAFLMGYTYYQLGQLESASKYIEMASKANSDDAVVKAVAEAIKTAIANAP